MATFLREDGESAILALKYGAIENEIRIPRAMLPSEVQIGQSFTLSFQPEDAAKKDRHETMKKLLEDLIR